ncbi:MAG: hypothetical protein QXE96_02690 [Candidatus Caldarchaeum sp.]
MDTSYGGGWLKTTVSILGEHLLSSKPIWISIQEVQKALTYSLS